MVLRRPAVMHAHRTVQPPQVRKFLCILPESERHVMFIASAPWETAQPPSRAAVWPRG